MRNLRLLVILARFLAVRVTGSSIYVLGKRIFSLSRIPSYLISGSILGRYNELRSGARTPAQNVCCPKSNLVYKSYLTERTFIHSVTIGQT